MEVQQQQAKSLVLRDHASVHIRLYACTPATHAGAAACLISHGIPCLGLDFCPHTCCLCLQVQQLSAWPFVGASFAFGILALLPLLSSWRMPAQAAQSLPLRPQMQLTNSPRARSADFSLLADRQSRLQATDHSGTRPSVRMSDCWPSIRTPERQSRQGPPEAVHGRLPPVPPVLVVGAASCIHQALTSSAWVLCVRSKNKKNYAGRGKPPYIN
eukprot:scaffold88710_cov21-Tisochrysis_lutea.AAC.1